MRDAENIRALEEQAKPDLMGFICWERSPRFVSEVPAYLPQCKRVGVFVNPTLDEIEERNNAFNFSYIQLHGSESPEFCQAVRQKTGLQVIKAISINSKEDLALAKKYEGFADLLLFDTKCTTIGGSGKQFNWDILSNYRSSLPFLLSGGIGPEDAERLKQFHHDKCLGFDINSRFELEPGIKDTEKIRTFIRNIRTSEQNKLPL
jgi:phosphoribosylanthranilate isomerase